MASAARPTDPCGVGDTLQLVAGRWKGPILWWLQADKRRFNELRRLLPEITQRVLTSQLRQLERDGLVSRRAFAEIPPRVEYSLTPLGRSLLPLLDRIRKWGAEHLPRVERARSRALRSGPAPSRRSG